MNGKLSFALLCLAALALACGPRSGSDVTSSAPSAGTAPRNAAVRSPTASPLTPSLDIAVDDGVRFAFRVVNEGKKKLELRFRDGRTHDVVVLDSLGREVWRWSEGRFFTQAMQNRVLRTSDSLRYEESWRDARPGNYVAVATLSSANFPVTERVEFTVR